MNAALREGIASVVHVPFACVHIITCVIQDAEDSCVFLLMPLGGALALNCSHADTWQSVAFRPVIIWHL